MPVALGSQTPSSYKLGSTTVDAVYMGSIKVWPPAATGPIPTSGLAGWWDADDATTFSYSSGTVVSEWRDKSGAARHASQTAQSRPTRNATINGRAAVYFDNAGSTLLDITPFAAAYTAGEIFAVIDGVTDVAGAYFFGFGTDSLSSHYTAGGVVYETFATTSRKNLGAIPVDTLTPHVYNVRSGPNLYAASVNGTEFFNTASNTVAFGTGPLRLGWSPNGSPNGAVGEIVMYNRVLTTPERQQVEAYLTNKWMSASPIPTSGLVAWWDADDATTFSYSSGTIVSQWRDKSSNAKHLAQANTLSQPSRHGTQNGKTTVVFGGDDLVTSPTPATTAVENVTAFVACKRTGGSAVADCVLFMNGNPPGDGWGVALHAGGSSNIGTLLGGYAWVSTTTVDPVAPGVLTLQRDSVWKMWLNGVDTGLADVRTTSTPSKIEMPSSAHQFTGEIYETIVYNRVLSTPERQQVEAYLTQKWMPFTPAALTGLQGWWDADDAATFIFGTGTAVAQWNDKSGNNFHATQSDPSLRPSRTVAAINGRAACVFGGKVLNSTAPADTFPYTVFMIYRAPGAVGDLYTLGGGPSAASGWLTIGDWYALLRTGIRNGAAIGQAATAMTANTVYEISTDWAASGAWTIYFNGTLDASGTATVTALTPNTHVIGAINDAANAGTTGQLAEIIKYNRVLSTPERQQVEAYLKAKWGTP